MAFTIDDLDEDISPVSDDIFHTRTAGGIDKKISFANLGKALGPSLHNHIRSAEYTKITGDAKWTTILRTKKNVSLFLQITLNQGNNNERMTLAINGANRTNQWGVSMVDYNTSQKPYFRQVSRNSYNDGSKQGCCYRLRWGDAGNNNGFCLQMQINYVAGATLHHFNTKVRAAAFGAGHTDGTMGDGFSFFDTNPARLEAFQDQDSLPIVGDTIHTYHYTAFSELIKAGTLRAFAPDYTVYYEGPNLEGWPYDDATPSYIKPGIYNNLEIVFEEKHFKRDIIDYRINMLSGKYVILGDFKVTVHSKYIAPLPKVRIVYPDSAAGYTSQRSYWLGSGQATRNSLSGAVNRAWFGDDATTKSSATTNEPWGSAVGSAKGLFPFARGKFGGGSGRMGYVNGDYSGSLQLGSCRGGAGPCGGAIIRSPIQIDSRGDVYPTVNAPWGRAGWVIINVIGRCDTSRCTLDASATELARGGPDQTRTYPGSLPIRNRAGKYKGVPALRQNVNGAPVGSGGGGFIGLRVLEGSQKTNGSNKNKLGTIDASGGNGLTSSAVIGSGGGGGGIIEVYAYHSMGGNPSNRFVNGGRVGIQDPDNTIDSGIWRFYDLSVESHAYNPSNAGQIWNDNQWAGAIINMEGGWWY